MKKYLECKTGDLYPTGKLRQAIVRERLANRKNYRTAPLISLEEWHLQLFEDTIVKVGDYVSVGDKGPFQIKEILVKHISHTSYKTSFVGDNDNVLSFECYGNIPVEFSRD